MLEKKTFDLSYLLLCMFMAVAFIPWVKFRVPFLYIFPVMLVWLIKAFFARRQYCLSKKCMFNLFSTLFFLGCYLCIGLIYLPFEHGDGMTYVEVCDSGLIIYSLLVFHLSVCNGRWRELRLLMIFSFLCLSISAAMTLIGEGRMEGASRAITSAAGDRADISLVLAAYEAGIGGFAQVYGLGLLIVPVLFCVKFMRLATKMFFTCLMVLFFLAVFRAGYSICIIGISLAFLLYIIVKSGGKLRTLKISGIILVVLLVSTVANPRTLSFIVEPLQGLSDMVDKKEYKQRIESVKDTISGNENAYASTRSSLYWKSWQTFLEHPFFGIGKYDYTTNSLMANIGGHSMVFDMLGYYGVFGSSIFILFLFYYYRYMHDLSALVLGNEWWSANYIFLFSATAIAFINPLKSYWIFADLLLFVPALTCFFQRSFNRPCKVYKEDLVTRNKCSLRQAPYN